jgi:hypothetical protein
MRRSNGTGERAGDRGGHQLQKAAAEHLESSLSNAYPESGMDSPRPRQAA